MLVFYETLYKYFVLTAFVKFLSFSDLNLNQLGVGFFFVSVVFSSLVSVRSKNIKGSLVLLSMSNVAVFSFLIFSAIGDLCCVGYLVLTVYIAALFVAWMCLLHIEVLNGVSLENTNQLLYNKKSFKVALPVFLASTLPPAPGFIIKLVVIYWLFLSGYLVFAFLVALFGVFSALGYFRLLNQIFR